MYDNVPPRVALIEIQVWGPLLRDQTATSFRDVIFLCRLKQYVVDINCHQQTVKHQSRVCAGYVFCDKFYGFSHLFHSCAVVF